MKRILITGVNSYIGSSFEKYLKNYPEQYLVDTISLKTAAWKKRDFSTYDVIFHVAGIAHVSSDPKMEELYYKVNRDLTIEVAEKAKTDGVKQFIFLSSIIVYGDIAKEKVVIDDTTIPAPSNFYGNSKLLAEKGLKLLNSDKFRVAIIRPPMVYGKDSKGNYPKLAKAARILPVFPDINNKRSMLHIDNLCEFSKLLIDNQEFGLFFPQNREYVNTSDLVKYVSQFHGKKIKLTKLFNPIIKVSRRKLSIIDKVFGSLVYDMKLSIYKEDYQKVNFEESLNLTEERIGNGK